MKIQKKIKFLTQYLLYKFKKLSDGLISTSRHIKPKFLCSKVRINIVKKFIILIILNGHRA